MNLADLLEAKRALDAAYDPNAGLWMPHDVDVLVPVLCRPHRVGPLIESFEASETPGRLLFIVNEDDDEERSVLEHFSVEVLVAPDETISWPQKINAGYRATHAPWMLLCADDVDFHPGWWDATREARKIGFGVIGTNDLGNPRVISGKHSTHSIVKRSYADEFGTIDTPGEVVCELYRHWFCDDELVATAKSRNQWISCTASIVEHLHPYWKKGEWDSVYELGESKREADAALWRERQRLMAPSGS